MEKTELNEWNQKRRYEYQLDRSTSARLGDYEITDRDRLALALRELGRRGYDAEPSSVDWTKPLLITSVLDSEWMAFGPRNCDFLHEPMRFVFKGDPALVEAVFQAVDFATRVGVSMPDDESEVMHLLKVAPWSMVSA